MPKLHPDFDAHEPLGRGFISDFDKALEELHQYEDRVYKKRREEHAKEYAKYSERLCIGEASPIFTGAEEKKIWRQIQERYKDVALEQSLRHRFWQPRWRPLRLMARIIRFATAIYTTLSRTNSGYYEQKILLKETTCNSNRPITR